MKGMSSTAQSQSGKNASLEPRALAAALVAASVAACALQRAHVGVSPALPSQSSGLSDCEW